MSDWLGLLANAVGLANDFAECRYEDGSYEAEQEYEELQEAKKDAIEALAEELQNHCVIKGEIVNRRIR